MRTLADFSALADERRQENVPEPDVTVDVAREGGSRQHRSGGSGRSEAFASSASAYNGINATLGSFYETPEEDPVRGTGGPAGEILRACRQVYAFGR